MADDDYSVGLVAEKIAHSPYAGNTLIFVIEDDPQDGADHVSGDRSLAFIVGPYVKQNAVVSRHYTTVNMLRTMVDILGIEKLGVHDAGVPPMAEAFDITKSKWNYSAVPAPILLTSTLPLVKKEVVNGNQPMSSLIRHTMQPGGKREPRVSTSARKTGSIRRSSIESSGKV